MLPLVISGGSGAEQNRAIGVLVAGGQTLCLLLTLLAVPVFYSLWDDLGQALSVGGMGRFFARVRALVARRARPEPIETPVARQVLPGGNS
jgi:HAE1 family hydrophobic/amphiphilic exporter-1